ncbi:MAG TPA: LamG domain-containing protein, partial [Candidatus Polarisedimenticolia bacterium]|nr:LamG domain-containing protein [Candidatus Polarisedimenticolia bacterium]
ATLSPPAPSGQNRPICGSIALPVNSWAHVAATYDGTWHLYVNGVEGTDPDGTACTSPACDPAICTRSPGVFPRSDSLQHFGLGTAMNSSGDAAGAFAGRMDEVRVWSRGLSASEIAAGMNEQVGSGAGLVARWGLDENGGGDAHDSVGPSFENGTLQPGTTDRPAWVTGDLPGLGHLTCEHRPAGVTAEVDDSLRLSQAGGTAILVWTGDPGNYNVYRGVRRPLQSWSYNQTCLVNHLASPSAQDDQVPNRGEVFLYVVSRVGACGESVLARDSLGSPYPNTAPCP